MREIIGLDALASFVEVVPQGSFTGAGKRLEVEVDARLAGTSPALTLQDLGVPALMERSSSGQNEPRSGAALGGLAR